MYQLTRMMAIDSECLNGKCEQKRFWQTGDFIVNIKVPSEQLTFRQRGELVLLVLPAVFLVFYTFNLQSPHYFAIVLIPLLIFGVRNVLADGAKMNAGWWRSFANALVSGIINGAFYSNYYYDLYALYV